MRIARSICLAELLSLSKLAEVFLLDSGAFLISKKLTSEVKHRIEKSALGIVYRILEGTLRLKIGSWKPRRVAHDHLKLLRHSNRPSSLTNSISEKKLCFLKESDPDKAQLNLL